MGWDTSQYQTMTQAEFAEGAPAPKELGERLGSNLEYLERQRLLQVNAWTKGSDVWDHFAQEAPEYDDQIRDVGASHVALSIQRLARVVQDGGTHDEANHKYNLGLGGGVWVVGGRRADVVESIFECRVKLSAYASSVPAVGLFTRSSGKIEGLSSTDGAWFRRGTNTNTWKLITKSGNVIRTTTDNQPGNYIGWDILKIEYLTAGCAFYINGTKVFTHTVSLPDTAVLLGGCENGTASPTMDVDWISLRAIANDDSP